MQSSFHRFVNKRYSESLENIRKFLEKYRQTTESSIVGTDVVFNSNGDKRKSSTAGNIVLF